MSFRVDERPNMATLICILLVTLTWTGAQSRSDFWKVQSCTTLSNCYGEQQVCLAQMEHCTSALLGDQEPGKGPLKSSFRECGYSEKRLSDEEKCKILECILKKKEMFQTFISCINRCVCPRGPPGPPGQKGIPGDTGPKGLQGPNGSKGPKGLPGDLGDTGTRGDPAGPPGLQGVPGEPGFRGDQGDKGIKGDTGEPGPTGEPGHPGGPQGPRGPAGPTGVTGPPGPKGDSPAGPPGVIGIQGPPGPKGPQGPQGDPGICCHPGLNGDSDACCDRFRPGTSRPRSN